MSSKVSVSQLLAYLKKKNDQDPNLSNVMISGELSNVKLYPSKHLYFDLKDNDAKISGIMFASLVSKLNFQPVAGDKVIIKANIKIYEKNAYFQLHALTMEKEGYGQLYIEFEKNKKQLENEGYFKQEHKLKIPKIPERIAVISGKDSAALSDILKTLNNRFKLSHVDVYPALVQGNEASKDMIKKIEIINTYDYDVIILARGGGSFEDLNAFNDVDLVKAIYHSKIPLISGVGHETDFTLVDFVSDFRANTPTAAAIKASPESKELLSFFLNNQNVIIKDYQYYLNKQRQVIDDYYSQLNNIFFNKLSLKQKQLQAIQIRLEKKNIKYQLQDYQYQIKNAYLKLNNLYDYLIESKKEMINDRLDRILNSFNLKINNYKLNINEKFLVLNLLDPNSITSKGYAIVYKDNELIKNAKQLIKGDSITIKSKNYHIKALVEEVDNNE